MMRLALALSLALPLVTTSAIAAQPPAPPPGATLAQRVVSNDPSKYTATQGSHSGPGILRQIYLLGTSTYEEAPLIFFQRGVLDPKSGIGHHFHNECEEMFVVLGDGEAEFTVDGRTSLIKAPVATPVRAGHSHALYNPTDKPIFWMDINVGMTKQSDSFDLRDPRQGVMLDQIPQFMHYRFEQARLQEREAFRGGVGKVMYRRALGPTVFATPWSYVDHIVIPPGASLGAGSDAGINEIIYVISGNATVSLNGATAPMKTDDVIAFKDGEAKGLRNSGSTPLEVMVVGIANNLEAKRRYMAATSRVR